MVEEETASLRGVCCAVLASFAPLPCAAAHAPRILAERMSLHIAFRCARRTQARGFSTRCAAALETLSTCQQVPALRPTWLGDTVLVRFNCLRARCLSDGGALLHRSQHGTMHNPSRPTRRADYASRLAPGVSTFYHSLKYYFHVNNAYVRNKLQVLLVPRPSRQWSREAAENVATDSNLGMTKFAAPAYDINAPDLYIPLMAFITYVLLIGLSKGSSGHGFTPQVLADSMSTAMCVYRGGLRLEKRAGPTCERWGVAPGKAAPRSLINSALLSRVAMVLEVAFIKAAMYIVGSGHGVNLGWLDCLAYSGYKMVALCINLILGIVVGSVGYHLALLYTGACVGLFVWKSTSAYEASQQETAAWKLAMRVWGASQLVLIWLLGDTSAFSE